MTSIGRYIKSIIRFFYRLHYSKKLGVNFKQLNVSGPCLIHGEGIIKVGSGVVIRSSSHKMVELFCAKGASLILEDNCFLNQGVHIACSELVRIGQGTLLGDEVLIIDNDFHAVGNAETRSGAVILEKNVWVASRAIILKGVHIGEGAVIGAGAVVTRSVPARSLVAGNPARIIRQWEKQ